MSGSKFAPVSISSVLIYLVTYHSDTAKENYSVQLSYCFMRVPVSDIIGFVRFWLNIRYGILIEYEPDMFK